MSPSDSNQDRRSTVPAGRSDRTKLFGLLVKADPDEAAALRQLIHQAAELAKRRRRESVDDALLVAALNQCSQPIAILGQEGRIRLLNHAATVEFAEDSPLAVTNGYLHAADALLDQRLQTVLVLAHSGADTSTLRFEVNGFESSYDVVPLPVPQQHQSYALLTPTGTRYTNPLRWRSSLKT